MSEIAISTSCADQTLPFEAATGQLDAVFDRQSRALYRFFAVRTGGDAHLADDLMQQLWLQASCGRVPHTDDEIAFWLLAIARNLIRAHWRKAARRTTSVPLADPALAADLARRISNEAIPLDALAQRELIDQLVLALTELRAEEQELIVGHYFEDRSLGDLARTLSVSERAIEGRLYRARQALRAKLSALET